MDEDHEEGPNSDEEAEDEERDRRLKSIVGNMEMMKWIKFMEEVEWLAQNAVPTQTWSFRDHAPARQAAHSYVSIFVMKFTIVVYIWISLSLGFYNDSHFFSY